MTASQVWTFGEGLYRLTPPHHAPIAGASRFDFFIGGAEANVAVGLARLGLRVGWLSRLTEDALGQHIAATLRGQGVDVSRVIWTPNDRTGLYFMEEGAPPRPSRVIYDRAGSAMSRITPDDIPADLFQAAPHTLHTTGITLALSEGARSATMRAWELAQAAGWTLSFDLNHRHRLWSTADARAACEPFLRSAHIIFIAGRDAEAVLGVAGTPQAMIAALHAQYPAAHIAMTLGADGAIACDPSGTVVHRAAFPVAVVNRIGAGDAFAAGFLYAHLTGGSLADACHHAAACAALKLTIPGDMPLIDRAMLADLLVHGRGDVSR